MNITIALVASYIAIAFLIAYFANRRSNANVSDFYLCSRNVSWFSLGFTLFATWMSTFAFLGSPGFYLTKGMDWFLPHALLVVASPMLLIIFGRILWQKAKRKGYITPGDFFAGEYNDKRLQVMVGLLAIIALFPYCLIQIIGVGKALSAASDGQISYQLGVMTAIISIAVYSLLGGVRAIVWTDIIQAILFISVLCIGAWLAIDHAGNISQGIEAKQNAQPDWLTFEIDSLGAILTTAISWTLGYLLLPHMWQRTYMAQSPSTLGKSAALGSALAFIFILLPSLAMGFMMTPETLGVSDSDQYVPLLFRELMPAVLPLLILAAFAAAMSTVDSQLLSASSVLLRDILQPLGMKQTSEKVEYYVGKVFLLVFLTLLLIFALDAESGSSLVALASKGIGIALLLFVPFVAALRKMKTFRGEGVAILLSGVATMLSFEIGLLSTSDTFGFGPQIIAFVVQWVLLISLMAWQKVTIGHITTQEG